MEEDMKIILTSDGISNGAIENALLYLLDYKISGKKACIITTASSQKEKSNSAIKTKELLLRLGFVCSDFLDIQIEEPQKLIEYDVVYINGGNPFYLLLWMKKRNVIDIIRELAEQNKVIIGTSAGAMVLANSIEHVNELNIIAEYEHMDLDELIEYRAVGITDITVVPHYNRFICANPEVEIKLKQLEKDRNLTFERVRDGKAVIINGDIAKVVTLQHEDS
jgi:dipeptidase E